MFAVLILKLIKILRLLCKCFYAVRMILKDRISFFPPEVDALETKLKSAFGKDVFVMTVSNATVALSNSYQFLKENLQCNSVLVNPLVIPSNYVGALNLGFSIKTIRLDEGTLNFDLEDLEVNKKHFDLVCVTHYFGYTCDMDRLASWCKLNKKPLIEDCSHSHGGTFNKEHLGLFGDVGIFSTQGSKFISGGEGAYIVTKNKDFFIGLCKLAYQDKWKARAQRQCVVAENGNEFFGLKARMHPLAAALSLPDLFTMNLRNRLTNLAYDKLRRANPAIFPTLNNRLTMGGFANGVCVRITNPDLINKIKKNRFLRGIVYTRDYIDTLSALKIKLDANNHQQLKIINSQCLYFTEAIFLSLFRYWTFKRLISLNKI